MKLQVKLNLLSLSLVLLMTLVVLVIGNNHLKTMVTNHSVELLKFELNEFSSKVVTKLNRAGVKRVIEELPRLEKDLARTFNSRQHFVIDGLSGKFVQRPNESMGKTVTGDYQVLFQADRAGDSERTYLGQERLFVATYIPAVDWLVGTSITRKEISQRIADFLKRLTLVAVGVLAFSVLVLRHFGKQLVTRLNRIDSEVALIESGKQIPMPPNPTAKDEIDRLQLGVINMGQTIHLRERERQQAQAEIKTLNENLISQNQRLRKMGERFALAADVGQFGVWEWDVKKDYLTWDQQMLEIYGVNEDTRPKSLTEWLSFLHPQDRSKVKEDIDKAVTENLAVHSRFRINKGGLTRHIRTAGKVFYLDANASPRLIGINQDISNEIEREERAFHLAYHDSLTGLPNREYFFQKSAEIFSRASRYRTKFAICFMDLDGFKSVNDVLGHDAGDSLLIEIANRLQQLFRSTDGIARIGGDEFIMALENITSLRDCAQKMSEVLQAVAIPMTLKGQTVQLNASIGVAIFPTDGTDAISLMKHADTAMYAAKKSGKNTYRFFKQHMMDEVSKRLGMEMAIRLAIEKKEFSLAFQPKIALADEQPVGVEALIRWFHPEQGYVSPGDFIPVAESCQLIVELGDWVLAQALQQLQKWQRNSLMDNVPIAINLSSKQLHQPDFVNKIQKLLSDYCVKGELLELEITETTMMEQEDEIFPVLEKLQSLGIKFSIDDFGTGYSSLSYLKHLPVDTLKIDRQFVKDLTQESNDMQILAAVVSLGEALDKKVVAEGVESAAQLAILKTIECDQAQGFFIAKPMSVEALEEWWYQRSGLPGQRAGHQHIL